MRANHLEMAAARAGEIVAADEDALSMVHPVSNQRAQQVHARLAPPENLRCGSDGASAWHGRERRACWEMVQSSWKPSISVRGLGFRHLRPGAAESRRAVASSRAYQSLPS